MIQRPTRLDFITQYWYSKGQVHAVMKPHGPIMLASDNSIIVPDDQVLDLLTERVCDDEGFNEAFQAYRDEVTRPALLK